MLLCMRLPCAQPEGVAVAELNIHSHFLQIAVCPCCAAPSKINLKTLPLCLQSPGSDHLDADGKPLPAWRVRMRQRQRFWSTSYGFKVGCRHMCTAEVVSVADVRSKQSESGKPKAAVVAQTSCLQGFAALAKGVVRSVHSPSGT
jgi:hypothetical protein